MKGLLTAIMIIGSSMSTIPCTAQAQVPVTENSSEVQNPVEQTADTDADKEKESKASKSKSRTRHDFSIDLGMNNYLENGKFPDEGNANYTVKPFGSWFVSLNAVNETHISGAFSLQWGGGLNWYNFKFQYENIRVSKDDDGVIFEEDTRDVAPVKSKLTASYLNVHLVPMLDFGKKDGRGSWCEIGSSNGFRVGLGAYGGYRLGNHTKSVYEVNGDKQRDKSNDGLFLNNWRYGARLQLGFKDTNFFVNYDLNELFSEGNGPKLNAFSFGISLI